MNRHTRFGALVEAEVWILALVKLINQVMYIIPCSQTLTSGKLPTEYVFAHPLHLSEKSCFGRASCIGRSRL